MPTADLGGVLVIGFATAVGMWAIGYLCRLPGAAVPAPLIFVGMIGCMLLGGAFAGRTCGRGVRSGLAAGVVTGLVNLLILGSLLGDGRAQAILSAELARAALLWAPASIAIAAACGGIGARLGAQTRAAGRGVSVNWPAHFAWVATVATLLLIPVGGIVTGYQAGLAVPDWPGSYGYNMFLYPLARMTGGIYFEHAHRLFGALVGLTTLALTVYLQLVEPRGWVRALAWVVLLAVVVQGVLGGLRVTEQNLPLAVVHGVLAQVFLATVGSLCVFLSRAWQVEQPTATAAAVLERRLGLAALAALLVQLILGAVLRHTAWGLWPHIAMAGVVLLALGAFALRCWGIYEQHPVIARMGAVVLGLLGTQFLLGFAALVAVLDESSRQTITAAHVAVTTLHQALGAVLLAAAAALVLLQRRLARVS